MKIRIIIIVIISVLFSCGNQNEISNANLLKMEKSLAESISELEIQNLMIEGIIKEEIWDRTYPLYDSIEIVMDTILDEFIEIEDYVKDNFPSNCRGGISNNMIEDFTKFYSLKANNALLLYSTFLRNNYEKYDMLLEEMDKHLDKFGQNWIEDLTSENSYIHQKDNTGCDFRLLFIKRDILKQKNELLSKLSTLIKRPCFYFETHYPIVLNSHQVYSLDEKAITKIALGTYFGGTRKNTELFVNGKQVKEYNDGVYYYDLPTDKKGKHELLLKIFKKNPFNHIIDTNTRTFIYEVK